MTRHAHACLARIAGMCRQQLLAKSDRVRRARRALVGVTASSATPVVAFRMGPWHTTIQDVSWRFFPRFPRTPLEPLLAGVAAGAAALLLGDDDAAAGVVIHGGR